ncbi:myrosinase 1-like [Spodoptera litura]|uniref:Myrosinase 1-like n=1 Tax=Spodoptera litura TaxID=69820 RepID=A0A9J7EFF5_SPOLT|nr:myrosinase 1-like [Spodoptera litura]
MNIRAIVLCVFTIISDKVSCKSKSRPFPPEFMFGAATSAYQVEGGWHEDGKSPSIWDVACHSDPTLIKDETTADVAADSYHRFHQDVTVASDLGLDFYRFSISWPRVLPNGFSDKINHLGMDYYNELIDKLLARNIIPMVTIYHWDLPDNLQKIGGWANPAIVDIFVDYAKFLFIGFGEKVKYWITFDDPREICVSGYGSAQKAPFVNISGVAEYMCTRNVLLAHAKAYHYYDEELRKTQNGSIGISLGFAWYEPTSDTTEDHQAAEDARQFEWGLYAHPIFSKAGDYPQEVKKSVAYKSAEQSFPRSRLIELSPGEVALIRGSADFLGVNAFTSKLAYRDASLEGMYPVPSFKDDMGAVLVKDPSWTQSESSWLQEVPWGFFKLLNEIKSLYDNPPVFITANGWSTAGGLLDEDRINYLRTYLNALLDAIYEGCDIKGYSVWSLIDTFEWRSGYLEKFGLYEVDFSSQQKTRTPRKSAFIYREMIRSKKLNPDFEPEKFIVEVSKDVPEKSNVDNDVL